MKQILISQASFAAQEDMLRNHTLQEKELVCLWLNVREKDPLFLLNRI